MGPGADCEARCEMFPAVGRPWRDQEINPERHRIRPAASGIAFWYGSSKAPARRTVCRGWVLKAMEAPAMLRLLRGVPRVKVSDPSGGRWRLASVGICLWEPSPEVCSPARPK